MRTDEMGLEVSRDLYERAIGSVVIDYINTFHPYELSPMVESEALKLIAEIKAILDDESLADPECFRKIDAIVDAFNEREIYTTRHDW